MSIGFSKTFSLEREILSKVLSAFLKNPQITHKEIMDIAGIGHNKVSGYLGWISKLNFRNKNNGDLTPLAQLILEHDEYLELPGTLWLLHYQLASNEEAEVWFLLTNKFLPYQDTFSYEDAVNFLVSLRVRPANNKHLRSDVSVFLHAFITKDSLGEIEFIKTIGTPSSKTISKNKFVKTTPSNIPPHIVAYVLFDQRRIKYPNLSTITIEEILTDDGNIGKVFSLNRVKLEEILKLLSGVEFDQLISLSYTAGLDQVVLKYFDNPLKILEKYYNSRRL